MSLAGARRTLACEAPSDVLDAEGTGHVGHTAGGRARTTHFFLAGSDAGFVVGSAPASAVDAGVPGSSCDGEADMVAGDPAAPLACRYGRAAAELGSRGRPERV